MRHYKIHPKYKKSGVDWLDVVPSHWTLGKLGACFSERNDKVSDTEYPPLSVTKNGIVPQMEHVAKTDAGDNRKKVCKNDFVINSRSDRKGSSGVSEFEGSVSLISTVLEPGFYLPRFAHHLFRSYNFQEEFYRSGKGIVADLWSTRYAEMKNILVPLVPEHEQEAIANFLDRETARIDNLIAEKQTFINLLKEKRQALISHVVTKGLDPNVKMKDSGIDWIGEVPEHWEISKIKNISLVNAPTKKPKLDSDILVGFVPMTNIDEKKGVIAKINKKTFEEVRSGYTAFQENDVIFAKITPCMENGNCAIVPKIVHNIAFGSTEFIVFRAYKSVSPNYLHLILRNKELRNICERFMTGTAGQQRISTSFLSNFPVALPSIEEQRKIVQVLKKKAHTLESLEDETFRSISLLKEQRTALISAAVTGKIDVRNYKRRRPHEAGNI